MFFSDVAVIKVDMSTTYTSVITFGGIGAAVIELFLNGLVICGDGEHKNDNVLDGVEGSSCKSLSLRSQLFLGIKDPESMCDGWAFSLLPTTAAQIFT